ncbi:MAG: glycosyltransferase [Tannerella sp.]|nr:glycosyltransferase [Tannerella sp.]
MRFSLIVPVYNRPDEVAELLESMTRQTVKAFEVILIEDGSTVSSEPVAARYAGRLSLSYFRIPNSGPGKARNYGADRASGDYLVVLDSDCILPPDYIRSVGDALDADDVDAFGGPDRAAPNFTDIQKAINYAMTSFFTTGGIRGGHRKLDKFYPRSFNMGIRRDVYARLGGFSDMRFGEDIDFSLRLYAANCTVRLFPAAWVYHKRRTGWKKFYRQVCNSGIARIHLYIKYPHSLKAVHFLPACFTLGTLICLAGTYFWAWSSAPLPVYALLVCADATAKNKSLKIGLLAVVASCIQLTGYGCGFLLAAWNRLILKKGAFSVFKRTFYR